MAQRFDKFTESAQKVFQLAQEEAQRLNHNYIGTEHLLLALVRERRGVAAKALANVGVELNQVRSGLEFLIGRGSQRPRGDVGLTPRAKKVIELSVDEARRLDHNYIGTEHLLLGLLREGQGIGAGILESLGVSLDRVRAEVIDLLNRPSPEAPLVEPYGLPYRLPRFRSFVSRAFRRPVREARQQPTADPWRAFGAEPKVVSIELALADLDRLNDEIGYHLLATGPGYECGIVRFLPRSESSGRQITHQDKDVVCHVLRGRGELHLGAETREVAPGDICHIPTNTAHDFAAVDEPLVLFYTSVVVPPTPG